MNSTETKWEAWATTGWVALAYTFLGKLSLALATSPGYASAIFPSSGIALAAVLIFGSRNYLAIFVGAVALNFWIGGTPQDSPDFFHSSLLGMMIGVGALLEAFIAVFFIKRFTDYHQLTTTSDVLKFLFFGGILSTFIGSLISGGALVLMGVIPKEAFNYTWWCWFVGDSLGVFIFAPLLLAFFAKPRALWKKRIYSVGLPLCVNFVLYVIIFFQAQRWELRGNAISFEHNANIVEESLRKSFAGYLDSMYALGDALSGPGVPTKSQFYSVSARWLSMYSGIYDFSWYPKVTEDGREAHVARARKEIPNYDILEVGPHGEWLPASKASEYFPGLYIFPPRTDTNVLGYNQLASIERYQAMMKSRDTGAPAAIGPVPLISKLNSKKGLVIFLAVYLQEPTTLKERRQFLKGYIKTVFSMDDVLKASIAEEARDLFQISIYDDVPSHGRLLYPKEPHPRQKLSPLVHRDRLAIADRNLWIEVRPCTAYLAQQRGEGPWILLTSGLFMSGLLAAFLLAMTGSGYEIERKLVEKKQLMALLEKSSEELSKSNGELQQFAYMASHDLQEPLRTITSYLQLIERRLGTSLETDTREFMDFAVDAAKRMSRMISDLLAYSRIGRSGNEETIDTDHLLQIATKNLHRAVEENQASIEVSPLPKVKLNVTEGVLLFQNLISNALKYHHKNTPVRIEVSSRREGDHWLFTVKDNGVGIPRDALENIFLMFRRAHSRTEFPGSGIGLAICKRIVEQHGGKIWAESLPGMGASFFFTLPAAA